MIMSNSSVGNPGELTAGTFKDNEGLFLQLVPFYKCSLKCKYCFTFDRFSSNLKIPLDKFEAILKKFNTFANKYSYMLISILGGELTESEDYRKYLDIAKKYLYDFKDKVEIEFLSNLTGKPEDYEYFLDIFSEFKAIKIMGTFHNNATRRIDRIKDTLSFYSTYSKKPSNATFEIVFLQNTSDEKYNNKTLKNYDIVTKEFPNLNIDYTPLLDPTASFPLCPSEEKNWKSTRKVFCHANYISLRPEGIDNGCTLKNITHEDFLKSGFGAASSSMMCKVDTCPCYPELRDDVGYINMQKTEKKNEPS